MSDAQRAENHIETILIKYRQIYKIGDKNIKNYKMWIGGKWVGAASGKIYQILNPATEEEIAKVPLGDKADVDKAVEAARKAFPIWSKNTQVGFRVRPAEIS